MSQKSIVLIVVLFALIIVGMFIYANLKQSELEQMSDPIEDSQAADDTAGLYPEITRIDATHYFIDGKHTLVGEMNFPTPCDLLEADSVVMESYPEQVAIDFTVINNAETCAQVVTAQRFKVEAVASAEAKFSAKFMGRNVELNITPAPAGERPEDFEVFIKG